MHTTEQQQVIQHVELELKEMKALGMRVPFDPAALTEKQKAEIVEYREGGMKISQIADLLISLG